MNPDAEPESPDPDPYEVMRRKQTQGFLLMYAAATLGTRELFVVVHRFWLGWTYGELAEKLDVCRERVRQIESKAVEKIGREYRLDRRRAKGLEL